MVKVENVSEVECEGDCRLIDRRKKGKVVIDLTSDSDELEADNKEDQGIDGIRVYAKRGSRDGIEEGEVKDNGVEGEVKDNGVVGEVKDNGVVGEAKDNGVVGEAKE